MSEQEVVKGELERVELGALKGNQGDQNYDLPEMLDLNQYQAVAIYCERFHAIFGVAKEMGGGSGGRAGGFRELDALRSFTPQKTRRSG
jgi:Electron transfer DM13